MLLVLVIVLSCLISEPVTARAPINAGESLPNHWIQGQDLAQQGKTLYEADRFPEAVQTLLQAVREYQSQRDNLRQSLALSNLSLVYQQLGLWSEATQAIDEALHLLNYQESETLGDGGQSHSANLKVLAQALEIKGSLQFGRGQAERALELWQKSAAIYTHLGDRNSTTRSLVSEAQALQVLGFYHRALTLLNQLHETLRSQPDSVMKAAALRSLGDTLQLTGDLESVPQLLQESLEIARRLQSSQNVGAALFSLGNLARAQGDDQSALAHYQQAREIAPSQDLQVEALINQFSLLVDTGQLETASKLIAQIQTRLAALTVTQSTIYDRINFAQSWMKLEKKASEAKDEKQLTAKEIAQILATAIQQAKSLRDQRAEAYALGSLGTLYEQNQQWSEAQALTQQALLIAQTVNATDITYRWQWQLGRLFKQQGNIKGAIAAYDSAIAALQLLRSDLVGINSGVQISFRESVEPAYRESVELLLQNQGTEANDQNLDKARQRIEALQLAELDNFFRQACLNAKPVLLDKLVDRNNPTTAIIYPIILPDQLQVIVKLPNQALQHYSVAKSQKEVETVLGNFRQALIEPDTTQEAKEIAQQVYSWLVQPIASGLEHGSVNTLVFVLDGALRNVPMAALYDGKHYLVEKYAVALSLGLQLLPPKPLAKEPLNVLAAGLAQLPQRFQRFAPLPEVETEFNLITKAGVAIQELLNQAFTSKALEAKVNSAPFNVVHLATHGQFSSQAQNTFILAADGPINVTQMDSLLRSRDKNGATAIELLVLSACETATGDNRATLGLAGVAVRAGARSTVASLWHINDRSTAILIGEFYRELAHSKVTKAEALRRAQVKLLKEYPNYKRPGYWAPFVLVGNWL